MNDALFERVAREDPARVEALTGSSRLEQDRAMRARLLAVIDRESPLAAGRFRGRGGSLLAAGASIVIVVAVIAVFATVDHQTIPPRHAAPADRDRSTAIPAKPVELYAAGVVDVGAPPQALLASGDALYVATPRSVVRLNLRNGSTIARTPIPTNGVNAGLAFGAGSIWLAPTGSTQLVRIDPTTGRIVASIHVDASVDGATGSLGGGVAYAAGAVWATRLSSGARGDVVAVNPTTNRIEGTPATVGTGPDAIVSGLGSLWVDNTSTAIGSTTASTTYSSLSRIDPRTQRVTTVPFSGTPMIGFGSLWIQTNAESDNGAVVRYDPATSRVITRIAIPRVAALGFGDGLVWAISSPRSGSASTFNPVKGTAALYQIDPRTDRTIGTPIHLQMTEPDAIAVSQSQLWIADYSSGNVSHFQLTRRP